ncbi:hypothetical protein CSUI_008899 [Cystoisospora suis]|uniref:Uncharacterized protein n=1 Tax=Cystoisospora suis TaxID=483139 RepID=A0A2C6KJJ0_9APIC|nr:hypothetical protein CSUI_008899 [Cystoisospora suis]
MTAPDRISVCPTNSQLLALYSSSSLSFLELLQAPSCAEPATGSLVEACNLAQHTVTDVSWVPVILKKKDKTTCCCVATSSAVVLVYQFTDEGSVLSPNILFTFLAPSPITSLIFADPFLITFHENLSVLFLKCNTDFAHPFDDRTYLQGSETDNVSDSGAALRELANQVLAHPHHQVPLGADIPGQALSTLLFLVIKRGELDLADSQVGAKEALMGSQERTILRAALDGRRGSVCLQLSDGSVWQILLPRSSAGQVGTGSRRASQLPMPKTTAARMHPEDDEDGDDEIEYGSTAFYALESKLLGFSAQDQLIGICFGEERQLESKSGAEIDVYIAGESGLLRRWSVELAEDPRESCVQTKCLPRCQMMLPTRISCLAPPVAHPELGQILLVASESGVIRWVDFAVGTVVKEIRLQEGTVRALVLCPEEQKYKGFSSILWGSLQDADTLVFLRAAGGKLCVTADAQRDIVVLGTISLSGSLGFTQQVRANKQEFGACAAAKDGHPQLAR